MWSSDKCNSLSRGGIAYTSFQDDSHLGDTTHSLHNEVATGCFLCIDTWTWLLCWALHVTDAPALSILASLPPFKPQESSLSTVLFNNGTRGESGSSFLCCSILVNSTCSNWIKTNYSTHDSLSIILRITYEPSSFQTTKYKEHNVIEIYMRGSLKEQTWNSPE